MTRWSEEDLQRYLQGAARQSGKSIMLERQFQAQLLELAKLTGWLAYHTHNSEHSVAGFPDTVLVKQGALLFAELKRVGKEPTPAQRVWLAELGKVTQVETYLWTPDDYHQISERLQRRTS